MNLMKAVFFLLGVSFFSWEAQAEFKGCHQWCGDKGNEKWWAVLRSHGLNENSTAEEKRPYTAEADRAKDAAFRACMQQTIAEGKKSDADCNGQSTGEDEPTSGSNRCQTEYADLVNACQSEVTAAKSSCNETNNSALSQAQAEASSSSGNSSSGVTDSCGNAQTVSSAAKNAWTSYRDQCSTGMERCLSKCNDLMTWSRNNSSCFPFTSGGKTITNDYIASSVFSPQADQCLDLQAKVDSANSTIKTYGGSADQAASCEKETSGGSGGSNNADLMNQLGGMASMLQKKEAATTAAAKTFCEANPAYPGCAGAVSGNCNDPAFAATNKVCQCAVNPYLCQTQQSSADGSINLASVDPSSRLPNQADNLSGDIPNVPMIPMGAPVSKGDAEGIDGRQGGAAVGSANLSGNVPKPGSNTKIDPLDPAAMVGGGGGSSGRNFGSFGRGSAVSSGQSGRVANTPSGNGSPDLRQFLPGGAYNPYATAVGGRVGIDGITGPNSNIWQKVQNRYRVLKETLHP